jgi:hypothetical protein
MKAAARSAGVAREIDGLFCWADESAKISLDWQEGSWTELSEHFIIMYVVARRMLSPTKQPQLCGRLLQAKNKSAFAKTYKKEI